MRTETFEFVHGDYEQLLRTLEQIAASDNGDSGTKANGFMHCMRKFPFFFGLLLCVRIFRPCEELSHTLQSSHMSAADMKRSVALIVQHLTSLRTDTSFDALWKSAETEAESLGVKPPSLKRPTKLPRRYDTSSTAAHSFQTPSDEFRCLYFQALDNVINGITSRFQQEGFDAYCAIEDLLCSASAGLEIEDKVTAVHNYFANDFDYRRLRIQLQMLPELFTDSIPATVSDIIVALKQLGSAMRLYSEVVSLVKLSLIIPVSTATAERTFSCLRRLQTFLRSTMTQQRLTNLLLLQVHKERTDKLDMRSVALWFVGKNDDRQRIFHID